MKMHQRYLQLAGIAFEDGINRRLDFHAMRHTYGTMLSTATVLPRQAMELMRHTDMKLTMKVYTDPKLLGLLDAVNRPPPLGNTGSSGGNSMGTDGPEGANSAPKGQKP